MNTTADLLEHQESPVAASALAPQLDEKTEALISIEKFRAILRRQEAMPKLDDRLAAVFSPNLGQRATDLATLTAAVESSCYGAFVFDFADWRSRLREAEAGLKQRAPQLKAGLQDVHLALSDRFEHLTLISRAVERGLRERYSDSFAFPALAELFMLDLLELLAEELDPRFKSRIEAPQHMVCHGCLDYGRQIQGLKVRDRRQMLAFNLVFLFRSATGGPWAVRGSMPRKGRPCGSLVADLVNAVIPVGADDTPITALWVDSTVKGILRDNPLVQVVPWPTGTDEVGFDTWYAPGGKLP